MPSDHIYRCRVCGLRLTEPPWGIDGKSPSHDICECCGVEHGYEDCNLAAVKQFRAKWLAGGAKWFQPSMKPASWSAEEQLKNVPPDFT